MASQDHSPRLNTGSGATRKAFEKAIEKEAPEARELRRLDRELSKARLSASQEKKWRKELEKQLQKADERVEFLLGLDTRDTTQVTVTSKRYAKHDAVAHLFASDWHVGERVDPKRVDGINRYDEEIAAESVGQYFDLAQQYIHWRRTGNLRIETAVLGLGGDLMTGHLHEDQRRTNTMHPFEECSFLLDQLEEHIPRFVERAKVKKLWVPCVRGNHGRNYEGKKRFNVASEDSYEQFIYSRLARLFRGDKRIEFILTESEYARLGVFGHSFRYMHGDQFNYAGGVGGIAMPTLRFIQKLDQADPRGRADMNFLGHWHQRMGLGHVTINGSLIGTTTYGYGKGFCDTPKQDFSLFNAADGLIDSAPICIQRKL